jgi:hypothetical protein
MFEGEPISKILYCYGVYQPLYNEMEQNIPNIVFNEGLPHPCTINEWTYDRKHVLIVIDDLIDEMVKSPEMEHLLTRDCHHRNCSVIYLSQNLYQGGRNARTIALNTWYLVLFQNSRDVSQISHLAKQMYPGKGGILKQAYAEATKEHYGYLVIDNSPHAKEEQRLRTRIFVNEDPIVYVPR